MDDRAGGVVGEFEVSSIRKLSVGEAVDEESFSQAGSLIVFV